MQIGNAMKTIASRITNISLDGEDILDPEEFKGIEKAFNGIGVALRENVYDMRDFEDFLRAVETENNFKDIHYSSNDIRRNERKKRWERYKGIRILGKL